MKHFFIILLCLVCLRSFAVTNTVDCTDAAIRAAIAAVSQGDVIQILPGSCTITSKITTPAEIGFTLRGSGTNQTFITSGNLKYCFDFESWGNTITVCEINFTGHVGNSGGLLNYGSVHYYNLMLSTPYRGINMAVAPNLVDHCVFINTGSSAQPLSFESSRYQDWTNQFNPIGTIYMPVIEDCKFYANTNHGNGYFDGYYGGAFTFRHNYCDGYAPSGVHGYDSGETGHRLWDINNNVFTNFDSGAVFEFRAGTGVVWSNQVWSIGSAGLGKYSYYRAALATHGYVADRGIPGRGKRINFTGATPETGYLESFAGQPNEGDILQFGFSRYAFTNGVPSGSGDQFGYYGGGWVKIGATVADTVANLYNAVNTGPGYGTTHSATKFGHDFLAIGATATDLILTNVLDGGGQYGYPANQQPGVLISYPLNVIVENFGRNDNPQVVWPIYCWGNTVNGNTEYLIVGDDDDANGHYITNLLVLGRDYFNQAPTTNVYVPLVYPHPDNSGVSPTRYFMRRNN